MSTTLQITRAIFALLFLLANACGDYSSAVYTPPDSPPAAAQLKPGLWTVSGSPSGILRFDPAQLLESGSGDPATRLTATDATLFTLNSVAFDAKGTVWVASASDSLLLGYAPAVANNSGSVAATIVISSVNRSISGPRGVAFDSQHRLWMVNGASGTIVRYDPDQLKQSGSPVPRIALLGMRRPSGIAFDKDGALWVTDIEANKVFKFSPDQLLSSGVKDPEVVISSRLVGDAPSIMNPAGLAFDRSNNLWVANNTTSTVVAFAPAARLASGVPIPSVTLHSNGNSLINPVGLAFDEDGSLWVMGVGGLLTKFSETVLGAGGSPPASVSFDVASRVLFWSIAFWPTPAGLPIRN